mgnify:CR=1 FL=1
MVETLPSDLHYDAVPNWDWRESEYTIHPTGSPAAFPIQSPFYYPLEGLEDKDFEPEDGWVLMARNFGSSTVQVISPFLILYNKYRGTIRLIVYLSAALKDNYSSGLVTLRFANGSSVTKNLTNRSILLPLNKWSATESRQLNAAIRLQEGWNYADFQVDYDPAVSTVVGPILEFDIRGIQQDNITLSGTSITTESPTTQITNFDRQALTLQNLQPSAQAAIKNYNSSAKYIGDATKWAQREILEKHRTKLIAMLGPAFTFAVANPTIIGIASGIVGFAQKFMGLQKHNNQLQMTKTETTITLGGSILAERIITTIPLRVPGANHNSLDNALPLWNYPLGVFTVDVAPLCQYATSSGPYTGIAEVYSATMEYASLFAYMDILNLTTPVHYVVNTSYPGHLELRSMEAAWCFQAPQYSQTASPGRWASLPNKYVNFMNAAVEDGRYVVVGSADPTGHKYFEYRTQFVDAAQFHTYKPEIPRVWITGEPYYAQRTGINPPVQLRARFRKPGGAPKDDVVMVDSYDLYWPNATLTPLGLFQTFPAIAPNWKYPVVSQQRITSLTEGAVIEVGTPWSITWEPQAGDVTNVQAGYSCSPDVFGLGSAFCLISGGGFETLAQGPLNTGVASPTTTPVGDEWLYLSTSNGPATFLDVVGVHFSQMILNSIAVSKGPGMCPGGSNTPTSHVSASWNTRVPGQVDQIEMWSPSGEHFLVTTTSPTPATSHSIGMDVPCLDGQWTYALSTSVSGYLGASMPARSGRRTISMANCGSCASGGGSGGDGDPGNGDPDGEVVIRHATMKSRNPLSVGEDLVLGIDSPHPTLVDLALYDVAGKRVLESAQKPVGAGQQLIRWKLAGLPPGAYFLTVRGDGIRNSARRLILIR